MVAAKVAIVDAAVDCFVISGFATLDRDVRAHARRLVTMDGGIGRRVGRYVGVVWAQLSALMPVLSITLALLPQESARYICPPYLG